MAEATYATLISRRLSALCSLHPARPLAASKATSARSFSIFIAFPEFLSFAFQVSENHSPAGRVLWHADGAEAAVAEVVRHRVVGGRAVVRRHERSIVPKVAVHAHGGISRVGVAIDISVGGIVVRRHRL